jgi:hypothetical protein
MRLRKIMLLSAIAALLLPPTTALARRDSGKGIPRIIVYPNYYSKKYGKYGFLPGYRQPPNITEWRDRSTRYGARFPRSELRFWEDGAWRYGWGGPGFYRGHWNGGSIGPCYTQTPIGPIWNCGQ